jgi:hypothetical protein
MELAASPIGSAIVIAIVPTIDRERARVTRAECGTDASMDLSVRRCSGLAAQ